LQVELPEFAKQLRDDKSNFFESAEELLAAFDTIIRDRVEPQLTKIFKVVFVYLVEYLCISRRRPLADWRSPVRPLPTTRQPSTSPGRRMAVGRPNCSSTRSNATGEEIVSVLRWMARCIDVPSSQPRYEMVSLSLHEACPGHHLQGDYIQQDSWPDFRKVNILKYDF
jgi:uncharacterized protein (DUF885 family)